MGLRFSASSIGTRSDARQWCHRPNEPKGLGKSNLNDPDGDGFREGPSGYAPRRGRRNFLGLILGGN
jgi:hypothetical protein